MKSTELFRTLAVDAVSELWNEDELPKCSLEEVRHLAMLLGSPKSGPKEKVIVRLLAVRQVRLAVAKYPLNEEGAKALVADNQKERLKWMAKEAGLWRSGNKLQLAIVVLQWRDRCRAEGQKLLAAWQAAAASQPKQLLLAL